MSIKTNRLFIGDVYCNLELIEEDALLVYFKGKGYLRVSLISSYYDYMLAYAGKLDRFFISTDLVIHKYYLRNIKPYSYLDGFKRINVNDLILLKKHKKSGF